MLVTTIYCRLKGVRLEVVMLMIFSCCHWRARMQWPGSRMEPVSCSPTRGSAQTSRLTDSRRVSTPLPLVSCPVSSLLRLMCLVTWCYTNRATLTHQTRVPTVRQLPVNCHNWPSQGNTTAGLKRSPRKSHGCFTIVTFVTKDSKTSTVSMFM